MAIIYEKIKEESAPSGIDVTVLFTNDENGKTATKVFKFTDQGEISVQFDTRMINAINNFIDRRERDITPDEIVEKLKNYFEINTELTRAQALAFMAEKKTVSGVI
jgi:hypothetical protein